MLEDLAIINNESYDLGLQEIEEAVNIQKQTSALEKQRNEKLEAAKIHFMAGVKAKTKELQSKLEICNKQIVYYHRIIGKIKQELIDNYRDIDEIDLNKRLVENQQKLNLWLNKEEEIKRLLEMLCTRYGHQIDINEKPVRIEENEISSTSGLVVSKYYICKCCGKEILLDDHFTLEDWEWYHLLNAKFTKRIVENEVIFEPSKLVLGKTRIILSDVSK